MSEGKQGRGKKERGEKRGKKRGERVNDHVHNALRKLGDNTKHLRSGQVI